MALGPNSLLENHPAGTGDINAIINGNWEKINSYFNPGDTMTARLDDDSPPGAGNVVNASANVFTSDDVGAYIYFKTSGLNYEISAYTSATKVTVAGSPGELASQPFILFRISTEERDVVARGLIKRPRMIAADDGKVMRWDNSNTRFNMVSMSGYGVAAGRILFGGGASADLASSSDLAFDDSTDVLTVNGKIVSKNYSFTPGTIASGTSIQIDFSLEELRSISTLAHNPTFTTANLVAGRRQLLRIVCDGTPRTFTFPGTWVWLGTAPAGIAASKTGLLSLISFSSADSGVVAKWEVEP